jgi:hypothetical protein
METNKVVNNFYLLNKDTIKTVIQDYENNFVASSQDKDLFDWIETQVPRIKIEAFNILLKIALARSGGDINTRVISVGDLQYAIRVQDGTEERISTEGEGE